VIDSNPLAGQMDILPSVARVLKVVGDASASGRESGLFTKLAGSTLGSKPETGCCCVKPALSWGVCKNTRAHKELNPLEADVPELGMPPQEFLLSF
jgi:hypothetical protein